jgi:hypothetical protein
MLGKQGGFVSRARGLGAGEEGARHFGQYACLRCWELDVHLRYCSAVWECQVHGAYEDVENNDVRLWWFEGAS